MQNRGSLRPREPGNLQSKALRLVLIITVHRKPKPRQLRDYAVPVLVSDASGWFPVSDPAEKSLAYRLAATIKIEPAMLFISSAHLPLWDHCFSIRSNVWFILPVLRLAGKELAESPLTADAKVVFIGFRRLGDQRVFFS